jgi:hypothetical protein
VGAAIVALNIDTGGRRIWRRHRLGHELTGSLKRSG